MIVDPRPAVTLRAHFPNPQSLLLRHVRHRGLLTGGRHSASSCRRRASPRPRAMRRCGSSAPAIKRCSGSWSPTAPRGPIGSSPDLAPGKSHHPGHRQSQGQRAISRCRRRPQQVKAPSRKRSKMNAQRKGGGPQCRRFSSIARFCLGDCDHHHADGHRRADWPSVAQCPTSPRPRSTSRDLPRSVAATLKAASL